MMDNLLSDIQHIAPVWTEADDCQKAVKGRNKIHSLVLVQEFYQAMGVESVEERLAEHTEADTESGTFVEDLLVDHE